MATGALLCVKILRRNAEHVVTLNANTMKNGLPRRRSFVFRGIGLGGFGCHAQILAYRRPSQHSCRVRAGAYGISSNRSGILKLALGAMQAATGQSSAV
jgi:hypothetical protein